MRQGLPTDPYDPTPQILAFLNDVQGTNSGMPKNNLGFSTDSAVWYLEAGLNYTLGSINLAYNMSVVDSIAVPLAFGEQQTAASAVYGAFDALVVALAPLVTDEQHIILVDVVEPAPGACEVLAVVSIGSDYGKAAPNTSFGIKDYFYYNGPGLRQPTCVCGGSTYSGGSYCANIIIQNRINAANLIALQTGQYITDIETWQVYHLTNIGSKRLSVFDPLLLQAPYGDGYRDTRTYSWRQGSSLGGTCLDPAEMTFWTGNTTSGTWSAIDRIKTTHCPNKTFLSCTIAGEQWNGNVFLPAAPAPGQWFIHRSYFRYGRIITPGTGG